MQPFLFFSKNSFLERNCDNVKQPYYVTQIDGFFDVTSFVFVWFPVFSRDVAIVWADSVGIINKWRNVTLSSVNGES